jgi:hypothetical protein
MMINRQQPAVRWMYAGLGLTVLATAVPYIDLGTGHLLADHIRAGYPTYTPARIDTAVSLWLAILTVVGALGVVGWLGTIWATRRGKGWARWAATALLVLGTLLSLTTLLTKDTSGDTGLAPLLGWIGLLPSVAGVWAVRLCWRTA